MAKRETETAPMTMERVALIKNKRYGERTITKGSTLKKRTPRIQTGIFAMTYATGGGYPLWMMSRLKGPEHGGKTSAALEAVKMTQVTCFRCLNIGRFCKCEEGPKLLDAAYCDIEGTLDRDWAECLGVDMDRLYLPNAGDGGEYLDIVDSLLQTDDCGVVVIDSVAQLLPPAEVERAIGDRQVGSLPKLLTDASAKLTMRLNLERRRGHPCFVICINQLRADLGAGMFGNPETEAGGKSFKHWFALGIRVSKLTSKAENSKANIEDPDESFDLFQKHGFRVDKDKVWTIAKDGDFVRARANAFHSKDNSRLLCKKGAIYDAELVMDFARKLGIIDDTKPGVYSVVKYDIKTRTIDEMVTMLMEDDELYYQLQKLIVDRVWINKMEKENQ